MGQVAWENLRLPGIECPVSTKQAMSDSHRLLLKLGEGVKIDAKGPRESLNIFE